MSEKFHLGKNGPSVCRARIKCRLGGLSGEEHHYESMEAAREAYEELRKDELFSKPLKKDYVTDTLELRLKYSIPDKFKFDKAHEAKELKNSGADYTEVKQLVTTPAAAAAQAEEAFNSFGNQLNEFTEAEPWQNYAFTYFYDRTAGVYELSEAVKQGRELDCSALSELNKSVEPRGGAFRGTDSVYVLLKGDEENAEEVFLPSLSKDIDSRVQTAVSEYKATVADEPVKATALYLGRIISTQPFKDGNKRTALYSASLELTRNGHPPLIPNRESWVKFSRSLDPVLKSGDLSEVEEYLEDYFKNPEANSLVSENFEESYFIEC